MGMAKDLLGDGRLLKQVLVEGDGPCPTPGKKVEVHYESVVVASGAKIDSSWDQNEPFDFVLGDGDVLEAWDRGVATMRPGELSEFIVDPSLAYGEEGAGDEIPAGATLKFTIELLSGKKKPEAPKEEGKKVSAEAQKLTRAGEAKDRGNELFKASDFAQAQESYREALNILRGWTGSDLEDLRTRNKLRLSCLLNITQCDLKLEEFTTAVQHATEALSIEPKNCKALYRRGLAHMSSGGLEEARTDLLEASRLDPQNAEVRSRLAECKRKMAEHQESYKGAFGGMFGKAPEQAVAHSRDVSQLAKVWLDFQIGSSQVQRMRIALYSDTVPRTANNFRALCTGEMGIGTCGQPLHYKKTRVHRLVPRHLLEAGDVESYDGSGGESVYGRTFPDEGFGDSHHRRGLLTMANQGPGTNNSKFMITLRSLPRLDGKNVVFGEVVGGMEILDAIEQLDTEYPDKPVTQVAIVDCGEGW